MYAEQVKAQQTIGTVHGYSGGALGALGAIAQDMGLAQRQPEVRAEMDLLERTMDTLQETADTLAERLETVRSQTGNQLAGKEGPAPEPVLCSYAQAIRTQRRRAEAVRNILQRALNELEI